MDQPGESSASSTRSFDTSRSSLTYAELSDVTAPLLEALLEGVLRGNFVGKPFDEELVNDFHRAFLAPMLPKMAGRWRATSVQVGNHAPPQPWEIPLRMRNYVDNVNARILGADTFELMGRLDIPPIEVAVERGSAEFGSYVEALPEYDNGRLQPLVEFWDARLQRGLDDVG